MCTVTVTGSASLRVLNVSDNPIGDDAMLMIAAGFQHVNLTELRVANCGLSAKGAIIC